MPDVEAYCPQALICSAANISFLLSCSVCSTVFPLAPWDVIGFSKLVPCHSWGHVVVLMVSVKLQLDLPTFPSHGISGFTSVLCHIHRHLPWAAWKNHCASGMFITNLQIAGWAVSLTGWVLIRGFKLTCRQAGAAALHLLCWCCCCCSCCLYLSSLLQSVHLFRSWSSGEPNCKHFGAVNCLPEV